MAVIRSRSTPVCWRASFGWRRLTFSASVELPGVVEAWRLRCETHREMITNPTSGRIDISILTTHSAAGRERRQEEAAAPMKLLKERGSASTAVFTQHYLE